MTLQIVVLIVLPILILRWLCIGIAVTPSSLPLTDIASNKLGKLGGCFAWRSDFGQFLIEPISIKTYSGAGLRWSVQRDRKNTILVDCIFVYFEAVICHFLCFMKVLDTSDVGSCGKTNPHSGNSEFAL